MKNTLKYKYFYFQPSPNSGFTLLEVMVAVLIIATVLVGVMRLQGRTIAMNETFRFYTIAPMLAQAKMSEIISNPDYIDIQSSGECGDEFPSYSWNVESFDIKLEVGDGTHIELKQVNVFISLTNAQLTFPLRQYLKANSS